MKKSIKILVMLFIMLVLFAGLGSTAHAYENFVIETYLVLIDVNEDNTMDIEEIIYANFEYASHGIYREIPLRGFFERYADDEFLRTKYSAIISDVEVINQKFTSKRNGNYQNIKIGDKDILVEGMQKYHIKYTLDFGDDGIDDFDEFYLNVIGTDWGTYINKVGVVINMPEEFDEETIGISTGYAGESGSRIVKYKVEDEKIVIHTTDILYPYEGLTVRIELPEGYFINERQRADWTNIFYYGTLSLVLLVMFSWLIFGKDEKLYPSVEFYPPNGLSPAEAGYIVDGYVDTKDVLSLLIYWADKGYIKIAEVKKNDFYIIKLKQLEGGSDYYQQKLFTGLFKSKVKSDYSKLIKLAEQNENLVSLRTYLIERQAKGEELAYIRVKDLQNVFYSTVDGVKRSIKEKYSKKSGSRIFTSESILAKVLVFSVSTLPVFVGNIIVKARDSIYMEDHVMGGLFWCGMLLTLFIIFDQVNARRKSMKTSGVITAGLVFTFLFIAFGFITIAIIGDFAEGGMIGVTATAATFIIAIIASFMEKRTPQVSRLQEKILGLRMFLVNAEQDRIEMLVNENPDYFFNILSYAYVLGVTDKWAKQFEKIVMNNPDWYYSTSMNTYFRPTAFTRSFTNNVNTMRTTMTSRPSSSSSGGSGGYSGGGGFSGGGGGGGGGGSW